MYVGNLANNVTVEDIIRIFPKGRRKDVGFARKMKNTRYAFVCFHTVADAIEALKKTHNTDLHCKSLIVRFRRLNNSFGVSDEVRQQNRSKTPVKDTASETNDNVSKNGSTEQIENIEEVNNTFPELLSPCLEINDSSSYSPQYSQRNGLEYSDDEVYNNDGDIFSSHRPKVKVEIKTEIKVEPPEDDYIPQLKQELIDQVNDNVDVNSTENGSIVNIDSGQIFNVDERNITVKEEPKENSGNYSIQLFLQI